jgi:metal-responsive CopG/Arc/MetJ family transcriptional regulator
MATHQRRNVCVTLPDALADQLDAHAQSRSLPRSYLVQELLERGLTTGRERLAELERIATSARTFKEKIK